MFIKLIGGAIVLIAATYLGLVLAKSKVERVRQIRTFISALNIIEIEIKFSFSTLPEIFDKVSKTIDCKVGEMFYVLSQRLINEMRNASEIWAITINEYYPLLNLNNEDKEILLSMGGSLGEIDSESQIKNIRLVIEQLKIQKEKAEDEKKNGERMYKTLGVLSGLCIFIILF